MEKFASEILETVRKAAIDRHNEVFADGFNDAANICVGLLSETIEGLMKKISSGSSLSDKEQYLLAKLNELKSEAETRLCDFWSRTNE